MNFKTLKDKLYLTYNISDSDVVSEKISKSDLAGMLKTIIENSNEDKRFYLPSSLYHNTKACAVKANNRKTIYKMAEHALLYNYTIYKFRKFVKERTSDSVYSARTIRKAKTTERSLFSSLNLSDCWRICKIEKAGGRNGSIHIQGLCAIPKGNYDSQTFQELEYAHIEVGLKQFIAYLGKPPDQNLERDESGRLINPFELALIGFAEWYIWSLKNRKNGLSMNPRTSWITNITRQKAIGKCIPLVSIHHYTSTQPKNALLALQNHRLDIPIEIGEITA